jgi:hypothetical protein
MPFPFIYEKTASDALSARINQLSPKTQALWGKMNVAQMLAHCCVSYQQIFGEMVVKPPTFPMTLLMKYLIKPNLISEKPFPKNSRTAPSFIIADERVFETEKANLLGYINKTQQLGETHFSNLYSPNLGEMTSKDYNNLLYKHLDHHLSQFGV